MSGTQMVFLIVLVMAAVQVFRIVYGSAPKTDTHAVKDLYDRIAVLEKRMENVETITTSKDYHLKQEFEELAT